MPNEYTIYFFNFLHEPKPVQMLHSCTVLDSIACMSDILFPIGFLLGFIIINNIEKSQGTRATNLSLQPYLLLLFII